MSIGLNPARVMIGSDLPKPLEGKVITVRAVNLADTEITKGAGILSTLPLDQLAIFVR